MSNGEIVAEIYDDVLRCSKMFCSRTSYENFWEDIAEDIVIQLLAMSSQRLLGLYERKELLKYVKGILKIGINSKTSPFFYKYIKPCGDISERDNLEYIIDETDIYEDDIALGNLTEEETKILKYYSDFNGNIAATARAIKKSYRQTRKCIKNIKKMLND